MEPSQLADALGIKLGTMTAAALGALLSLRWVDASRTWPQKSTMVLGGFCGATFGTPLAMELLGLHGNIEHGIAFFLGLFSMSLADALYGQIKSGALLDLIRGRPGA